MKKPLRELPLPNGLTITFFDHSRRYFGDFYMVKIEIICRVPILPSYFDDQTIFEEAWSLLNGEVIYKRVEEQMGVPSTEIDRVLDRLISNFTEHSLPYFSSAGFPGKIILAELNRIKKKKALTRYP